MKKKRIAAILAITIFCISPQAAVFANDEITNPYNQSVRLEQTGYLYKLMDGRRYKRLWSFTYGRWLEPDWSLV